MDQKMQNFSENRETIVPITFVNGNIRATEELNSMFTLPYDLAVLGRATTLDGCENIAKSGQVSEPVFKSFAMDVVRMNKNNFEDAIKVYLLMNCREFIYSFVCHMMNNICDVQANPNYRPADDDDYDDGYYSSPYYINDRDIDKLVLDHLNTFVFATSTNGDMTKIYYYQLMNSLYFQVVAFVDGLIRATSFRRYTRNNRVFNKLVEKVYGPNNGIDPKTLTAEFRYTFSTSIMREMAEKELPVLYQGLHKIFMTAASMACIDAIPNGREEIFGAAQPQIPDHQHECMCGGNCHHEEQPSPAASAITPTPKGFGRGKRK